MSDPVKIIAAWRADTECRILWADGLSHACSEAFADGLLAKQGQRAVWPDGFGPAVIEDIPPRPTLPEEVRTFVTWGDGSVIGIVGDPGCNWIPVARQRTWTDEDGTRRVEVEWL